MTATETQLKQMQAKEIKMLKIFVEICEELDLRYYILGGTLLGAVRHGGFIPWDDDIDVGMPREDYDIFMEKAEPLLPRDLFLQNLHTERECHSNAAKIRDSNTTYIELGVKRSNINHGVYIDIFPLDNYPVNCRQELWFNLKKKILSTRIGAVYIHSGEENILKHSVRCALKVVFPTMFCAVNKREQLYRSVPASGLWANHSGMWGKKEIIDSAWYAEGCDLVFEGITVKAPKEYKKWLEQVYGDYMQLPPEEKRVTHHQAEIIDMEKPYTGVRRFLAERNGIKRRVI